MTISIIIYSVSKKATFLYYFKFENEQFRTGFFVFFRELNDLALLTVLTCAQSKRPHPASKEEIPSIVVWLKFL